MRFSDRAGALRPSAIRAAGKLIASREDCITFAQGYPAAELMPIEEMREITHSLLSGRGETVLQYGMTKGNEELIQEIIKLLGKSGIQCGPEHIQITTGSQQGVFLSAMLLLNKGDTVVVENPTYLGALSSFTPFECRFAGIQADDQGMDMEALENKLDSDNSIRLIYVVPNFSNPTGKTWSLERRKKLLELAERYDVMILEDNPYGDIRFEGTPVPAVKSMDQSGRVIYLGSFSKILYAGLRVGFMVSSQKTADIFEVFKQGVDLQSNEFAQVQIAEFLKRYDLDGQIQRIIGVYRRKRDIMLKIIDEEFPKCVQRTHPEGGMFVWLTLPQGADASQLLERTVRDIGVGFVPGGPFFVEPGHDNTVRLNYSAGTDVEIEEGMHRLAAYLKKELEE